MPAEALYPHFDFLTRKLKTATKQKAVPEVDVSQRVPPKKTLASSPDWNVVKCATCYLVQYRTRTDNCRKCLHELLPPTTLSAFLRTVLPPQPNLKPPATSNGNGRQQIIVEGIGGRIKTIREFRGLTQSELASKSKVSRSYLCRIEFGQMTPSLGTLEKIAEALCVPFKLFFVPEEDSSLLILDPFISGLRPLLHKLEWEQWGGLLKRLQAIYHWDQSRSESAHGAVA